MMYVFNNTLVHITSHFEIILRGWLNLLSFRTHQIFEYAHVYTTLQFISNQAID